MYLLDTNVVSELRRRRPHPAVLAWINAQDDADLHVSAAAIGELQSGIERTRRQDRVRALQLEHWVEHEVLERFPVVGMSADEFREWARLTVGQSDTLRMDALIAATANTNDMTVVTRNVRDFEQLGVPVLNPFEYAG